eukprot:02563.XXX_49196_52513_1 [CDS] Oithona nana genome sequencing.
MLAEKIEGLEGELRYAWRALDVLSQEYVKMWQRLEKMEGLLSEQQTVITQLIDLYSADSSDNGTNGLKSGAASPSSVATGISKSGQQLPDENFYKALNAMHGDANTEMQLALSASQSMDDFIRYLEIRGKVVLPPKHENYSKQGTFTDFLKGFDSQPDKREAGHSRHHQSSKKPGSKKVRRGSQGSESDIDAKSVTSSIRSSLSGTVKSEEVGDFPLPSELSPSYENATPPTPPTISQFPRKKKKAVSPPQLQPKMKKSKVPKDANKSPLTVIGGKYSFSIDTAEHGNTSSSSAANTADALSSQHAANGKPLYPSLQTAMRPQNQPQSQKKSPPELKQAKNQNTEQSRKLSLKEKRKLRAERASELQPRDLDLAANSASASSSSKNNTLQAPSISQSNESKSPNKSSGESESISPNNTVKTTTEAGEKSESSNGVLMRTTSREFAVSRALGKYREKQKKQQKQQRNSVGSNSDSQEDLDLGAKTPTPKTSPPRISMIDEFDEEYNESINEGEGERVVEKSSDTDDSPLRPEEFEDLPEALEALGSRRQSTEESIDTDDEWYKHEIRELEQEAQEKVLAGIQPSESVSSKMNHVFIELAATVPRVEMDQCIQHDKAMKAKQNTSDEDHKKVIMRFQSSEDDEMMEEEESSPAQQLHAKRGGKGRGGRSESLSENDSDATQSGPDSLMEDTGGSSENILENKSKTDKNSKIVDQGGHLQKSSSSGSSRKSKKSVKTLALENSSAATTAVESTGGATAAASEAVEVVASASEETGAQDQGGYYDENGEWVESGGYYDENGDWVETGGYYDENGDWVETGGYYDETGEWVEYAGYYDENGEWVDVDPPEDYKFNYEEGGDIGGGGTVEDPPPPGIPVQATQDDQQNHPASFLANRGVAVFPQTQTAPLQKHPN